MDAAHIPSDEELKDKLSPEEYAALRQGETEVPFSGAYVNTTDDGMYTCKVCGNPLFSSDAKFETKVPGLMGWPSFNNALPGAVEYKTDSSHGMERTEIVCSKCGSHLGHVFDDESEVTTGKHYCVNSICLNLEGK